ncbi:MULTISPECIES: tripartite tricarboxylate transporter TctB family protein [unclassified Devosia]|uniref:tripartite tricarboxylate transporter TctB family protein n=1 Tax=unclassified Devosia TaxID=196773 RepID=UPI00145D8E83|nr:MULTISPECIES: tripartite tricarboxylate transporter TctB family protein [unclassified Devosia]MBJ6989109.1 tripartite tricarboxylate transporter TctB family protein [Devosia sp. MC521]QMW63310.1 tripartite tricarboxylate transporter TctB family protein [Devosia sp. MC521]
MRDVNRELVTAMLFIGTGLAFGGWALFNYDMGTMRRIGPGAFPLGLGTILAVIGAVLLLPAIKQLRTAQPAPAYTSDDASDEPSSLRAGLFVLLSLVAFALVLPLFGTIPALFALTYTAVLAEPGRDWKLTPAIIAAVLSAFVWLLFKQALSLPLIMLKWPL